MTLTRTRRRVVAGLALTLAVAGAAACGDDDDSSSDADAPTEADAAPVSARACDAFTDLSGALAGDPAAATPLLDAFRSSAPEALAEDAGTISATYEALLDGGAPDVFADPAYVEAAGNVSDAYFDGCDVAAELDVDGIDYGFEGIPETIDAGRVAIRFTNATEHDEPHELVLFRKNPGTTESAEQLLALPEEESMAKVTMAGVLFANAPGQEAAGMFDLEAGDYVAVCFIPVGGGPDGPPHFMSGMVAEFEATS